MPFRGLYQPIQKYKFESKSQLMLVFCVSSSCCINQYKNTNLKANHNRGRNRHITAWAVSTNTKIQIWKQITTQGYVKTCPQQLYQPIQKYKFESKSQPKQSAETQGLRCINQYKNTNLKANHNRGVWRRNRQLAVSTNTKIQIWKQITTHF